RRAPALPPRAAGHPDRPRRGRGRPGAGRGPVRRPRRDGRRRPRLAHGRVGLRQQVLPPRRPAHRRPAPPLRPADAAPRPAAGACVFFVAGLAELQRPPFDMPVADSEIIFGAYTEYTGLRFALFLLAEYAGIVVLCGLTTVLFLGGWHGPWGADGLGWVWTLLKTAVLAFVVIWLRVTHPRLREDQLQKFAWTVLVPLALAQIALTGIVKVVIA